MVAETPGRGNGFMIGLAVLGWLWLAALPAQAAGCRGLEGETYERCMRGQLPDSGPPTVLFFDAEGTSVAVDRTVVGRSMTEVCRAIGRDGRFQAYRSDGDRHRSRVWKELECRGGRLHGLWKEYFPSDDLLTVLSYDETGRAVSQAFYHNGTLLRETPIGRR